MNLNQISIAGPYTHDNLSMYLLLGTDTFHHRFARELSSLDYELGILRSNPRNGALAPSALTQKS